MIQPSESREPRADTPSPLGQLSASVYHRILGKVINGLHPAIDINVTFVITQFMIATSGREYCTLQVFNWRPSLSLGEVSNISRYVVIDAEN